MAKDRDKPMHVVYVDQPSPGYHPLRYMAHLAAKCFEAELIIIQGRGPTAIAQLAGVLSSRRVSGYGLLICPHPAALAWALSADDWRRRCGALVAWVFDSFWTNYAPRLLKFVNVLDCVFVAELEDLEAWRKIVRAPVEWLPWGSDVLGLGSANPVRSIDLLRVGRQPADWEDDVANMRACNSKQLRYHGRPPFFDDACDGERYLMGAFGQTKYSLSFSNRISPSVQTHPSREYITARWTDALSAGAIVAGVPPDCETARALLWEGALLDLGTTDRNEGLAMISNAVRDWTPSRAQHNYHRSLELLDWRWRFEKVAHLLGVGPQVLEANLRRLRQTLNPIH